jgi:hypothetical protein
MTDAYTKQLEAENAKLRETLEKQDATLGEFIRNRLEVKKDKNGSLHLRLKQKKEESKLRPSEFEILAKMDIEVFEGGGFPELCINDIVGVQPMMNNTTYKDVMKWASATTTSSTPTPSNYTIAGFSNISMPFITGTPLTGVEVMNEADKLKKFNEFKNEEVEKAEEEKP